jgi:2-(1,2-epoxy-1,2-dihydrophenyl)acetyl-CoA isomerase
MAQRHDYENFETTFEDGVLRATIDSTAEMNALHSGMAEELLDLAVRLQEEPVRCLVLTGSEGVYCAGGDIQSFTGDNPASHLRQLASTLHDAVLQLREAEVPIVTGVNGPAAGAGFSLAIFGDYVLASEDAYFQFGYPGIGATGDGSATYFLPRLVGLRQAKRLVLLNERVEPSEAVEVGLATEAVPDDEFDDRLDEIADEIAEGPTFALGRTQRLLEGSFAASLPDQLAAETSSMAEAAETADFEEGVRAFLAGEQPEFEGR